MTEDQGGPAGYDVSSDKARLDIDLIHGFLSTTYWAEGIPRDVVRRAIENSDCFGVYKGARQVGFARVISDHATFAYLSDVFVLPEERGRGLAKWLVKTAMGEPAYANLRRWLLGTREAHGLYRQLGFIETPPGRFMEIRDVDVYRRMASR